MENKTRFITQTAQERELTKVASDLVVFIEGMPYLTNPYVYNLNEGDGAYTVVSFNDHLVSFSATYDVDSLTPSANVTLNVPNALKYLYQSPGGNNLFETMMQVQVFAKGYFPTAEGDTVYRRVFKGLISHIGYNDTGTMLEISLQCIGIMHFMELMQVELNAALLSNSPMEVTPETTNQANMTPYRMLADIFQRSVALDGFQVAALNGSRQGSFDSEGSKLDWEGAVNDMYVSRWQAILSDLQKDVHILGYRAFDGKTVSDKNKFGKPPEDAVGTCDPNLAAAKQTVVAGVNLVDQANDNDLYLNMIRTYLPDSGIGAIKLLDGRITSRLERIRTIVNLMSYEGYQDVDGAIIFKPPFYNLDVTDIGDTALDGSRIEQRGVLDITEENNPFVVHLAELENEMENEDQQAVRETSIVVQPDWLTTWHSGTPNRSLLPWVRHIDIPKLCKFGLREQPARQLPFIGSCDKIMLYTYAVSEMNRANRGFRQYTFTIPMRPELKLGFPMFIPHKDMYGYIKTISFNYQQTGAATTTVTLDTIRRRPMFPSTHTKGDKKYTIYTTQPNLVMKWTEPPADGSTSSATSGKPATMSDSGQSTGSSAELINNAATQRQPSGKPIYQDEWEVIRHRREQLGTSWSTRIDTRTKSFRVQNDKATKEDEQFMGKPTGIQEGKEFFSKENWANPDKDMVDENNNPIPGKKATGVNIVYCQKILSCQPYTDENGYELVTPFPWGRWKTLTQALHETRLGAIVEDSNPQSTVVLEAVSAFIFAGVGNPVDTSPAGALQKTFAKNTGGDISAVSSRDAVFVLKSPKPGEKGTDVLLSQVAQPDHQNDINLATQDLSQLEDIEARVKERTISFIFGQADTSDSFDASLNTITTSDGTAYEYGQVQPNPPKATNSAQSFLDKLFNKGK